MNDDTEKLFTQSQPLEDLGEKEVVDLAGYQVTRGELFAHQREPAITIWPDRIKFNMACLREFPGITHIQLLIHPEQRRLIIRPCDRNAPDSLRWALGGGETDIRNRDMICRFFAAKVFDLMQWDKQYRYKMLGRPAVCDGEVLFLFKLTDFEFFLVGGKSRSKGYLQNDWRDSFGIPVEQHENSYKINLADGYIITDKI